MRSKNSSIQQLLLTICILVSIQGLLNAQQNLSSLPFTDFWQNNTLNPASFPKDKKLAIGLPSLIIQGSHNGKLHLKDLYYNENGTRYFNIDQVLSKLDDRNYAHYEQRLETVSLGLRLPVFSKTMITVGHAIRIDGDLEYNKNMLGLFWKGNAQYIGQNIDIAPVSKYHDFHELNVGIVRELGKVQIGLKGKYYAGISSLVTDPNANTAMVFTNQDIYQLTLTTNYGFSSSGIVSAIDTSKLGFDVVLNQLSRSLSTKNSGFGLDLGIIAPVTDRITIQASLLDLGGSIKWQTDSWYFKSQGTYGYDGVNIPGSSIITGGNNIDFDVKLDTLNDIFNFNRTAKQFTTRINPSGYLGGSFRLTDRITVGLSAFTRYSKEKTTTSAGVFAAIRPLRWLNLSGVYSVNDKSSANLGLRVGIQKGPVQAFISSDNVVKSVAPQQTSLINFRAGVGLVI